MQRNVWVGSDLNNQEKRPVAGPPHESSTTNSILLLPKVAQSGQKNKEIKTKAAA